MAQFHFQLEGVLRHRERIEMDCQRQLALAQGEMSRLQAELRALNEHVQATTGDVRDNHLTGRLDLSFLAAHRRYVLGMQRKAIGLIQRAAQQQRTVEEAQKKLAEAMKQRKILEKLREKQHRRWAEALARKEAAELDEITTQMSHRASVEGLEPTR